jgi:phosphoribosyl 1,2-cyclic phosphodiesterase
MKLVFQGTRGYIKPRSERHRMHASCRVSYGRASVVLDLGEDWLEQALGMRADAILVTHAHPDHAWGLKNGAPCPVYATEESWEALDGFAVTDRRTVIPRQATAVKDITFEAFTVEHSTRAPAVGYRMTAGGSTIFYAPDLVYIHERSEALTGARLYIGDGATVARPMVRKRGEALIGHVPVQTQLTWCAKHGVPRMVVTHCGAQIVGAEDEQAVIRRIEGMARDRGVEALIAFDGMELTLR